MGSKLRKLFLFFLIFICILVIGCSCETVEKQKTIPETKNPEALKEKTVPQTFTVLIENNKFIPREIDSQIGDKVTWINKDSVKHTITFEDVRLDQVLTKGAQISYTLSEKEEARYFCRFHPGMQGSVKVS
mgnify:CR=1 FL=1|tara:strand:+ start:344 stop:736 length:393 start_codon:yes stop_codon:yes gene_type:complete